MSTQSSRPTHAQSSALSESAIYYYAADRESKGHEWNERFYPFLLFSDKSMSAGLCRSM